MFADAAPRGAKLYFLNLLLSYRVLALHANTTACNGTDDSQRRRN